MANVRVLQRLQRISREMAAIRAHVRDYSGGVVGYDDVNLIDNEAGNIAEEAAFISEAARRAMGDSTARGLVTRVRKALGF